MRPRLFGFLAYQGLLVTVDYNNVNFLINALPAGAKKQMRTFIEGIAEPAATALAGLFLLLFARRLGPDHLALCGLLLALAGLALVFWLRGEYVRGMIANLKRGWLDFSRPLSAVVCRRPPAEVAWLAESARRAARPRRTPRHPPALASATNILRPIACLSSSRHRPEGAAAGPAQPLLAQMLADSDHEMIRRDARLAEHRSHYPLCADLAGGTGQGGLLASLDLQTSLRAESARRPRRFRGDAISKLEG